MSGVETDFIIMATSSGSLLFNAAVWYKLGEIKSRVESCENFKISPHSP